MGDFDSIKIGVCDCYWAPPGSLTEVFLGLTKGGCALTYTPQWYEITNGRSGKSSVDSLLTGEALSIKIPLAETDMSKLEMFAHTSTQIGGRLTFGSVPGSKLSDKAGRLRLHPISMGTDKTEDVVVYKAVNKAPLQLNYMLDQERIFSTEFVGLIDSTHVTGAMMFAIGDSTQDDSDLVLSNLLLPGGIPVNLMNLVELSGGRIWVSPSTIELEPMEDTRLRSVQLKAYTEFNGVVYDVTSVVTFSLSAINGVTAFEYPIINGGVPTYNPIDPAPLASDAVQWTTVNDGNVNGKCVLKMWSQISPNLPCQLVTSPEACYPDMPASWRKMIVGDKAWIRVDVSWGTLTTTATIISSLVGDASVGYMIRVFGNNIDLGNAQLILGHTPQYFDLTGMTTDEMTAFNINSPDLVVGGSAVIPDSVIGTATRLYGADSTATKQAIQDYYNANPTLFP
jgi:hypothetical protein